MGDSLTVKLAALTRAFPVRIWVPQPDYYFNYCSANELIKQHGEDGPTAISHFHIAPLPCCG